VAGRGFEGYFGEKQVETIIYFLFLKTSPSLFKKKSKIYLHAFKIL
jgi:hypothetical protein